MLLLEAHAACAVQEDLSGGRLRFGRWVPQSRKCKRDGAARKGSGAALPLTAPRMLRAFNESLDSFVEHAVRRSYEDVTYAKAAKRCNAVKQEAKQVLHRPSVHPEVQPSCRDWPRLGSLGVRLIIGVMSAPLAQQRRAAIRRSWSKVHTTNSSLACFVVGSAGAGVPFEVRERLVQENDMHDDLVLLPGVEDGNCHMTIEKAHAWWAWAAATSVPYIARTDDDSFVHLQRLEAAISRLAPCYTRLVFGMIAYVGYDPSKFRKCGYAWGSDRAWRRYGCGAGGAHLPVLFPSGMLQVLSLPVVQAVAKHGLVQEFVRRSKELVELTDWDRTEDVALGWWLTQMLISGERYGGETAAWGTGVKGTASNGRASSPVLSFVRAHTSQLHNLGCQKHENFYKHPMPTSMVIHYVKKPSGMDYLRKVLHEGEPHSGEACTRAAGVG